MVLEPIFDKVSVVPDTVATVVADDVKLNAPELSEAGATSVGGVVPNVAAGTAKVVEKVGVTSEPVPDSETSRTDGLALVVNRRVAVTAVVTVGVKVTLTVHVANGAKAVPQVEVPIVNAAEDPDTSAAGVLKVNVLLPVFFSVTAKELAEPLLAAML